MPELPPHELVFNADVAFSFEAEAIRLKNQICSIPGIVCACCSLTAEQNRCKTCLHAESFHCCMHQPTKIVWRKGTLFGGTVDYSRCIYNLHRKGLSTTSLKTKADEFVNEGLLQIHDAELIVQTIEGERGKERLTNEDAIDGAGEPANKRARISERLTFAEMEAELAKREEMMKEGAEDGAITDQFRVYSYIIEQLEKGNYLRLMVQARILFFQKCI